MNDKDRELIELILQQAGTTGQKGFAYLVHYKLVDSIVGMMLGVVLLVASSYAFYRFKKWEPRPCHDESKIWAMAAAGLVFFGGFACFWTALPAILAPEGAAIEALFKR